MFSLIFIEIDKPPFHTKALNFRFVATSGCRRWSSLLPSLENTNENSALLKRIATTLLVYKCQIDRPFRKTEERRELKCDWEAYRQAEGLEKLEKSIGFTFGLETHRYGGPFGVYL